MTVLGCMGWLWALKLYITLSETGSQHHLLIGHQLRWCTEANILMWFVRIVQVSSSKVEVVDADGKPVPSQLIPLTETAHKLRDLYVNLDAGVSAGKPPAFYLVFAATVPPLGYTSFVVKQASSSSQSKSCRCLSLWSKDYAFFFRNAGPFSMVHVSGLSTLVK